MIDEVRSGYRKKDNTEKEPLESYLVRSRVLAQEAEMNGDLSKARSLHFARVKRVDEEYVLDIEEIKQKQKTLQETIRECVRFCFRAKHTSEKETQELLKRSCALNFKDVFALKAYGCSLLSHERFDDAAAVFHHLEEVVSAIEESDDVVHDDDNEIKEQDAVALMCVLWTRASWYVCFFFFFFKISHTHTQSLSLYSHPYIPTQTRYGTFRHPKWQSVARGGAQNQAEALLRVAKSLSEYRMFELCEFVLNMARDVASQMSSDFTSRLSLESALCALRKGDFQYCLEMSCEALETSKENPSRQRIVYSVLGHANYSLNRHDNALTCYELSLNDQSNDVGLCELYPHISNSTTFDPFVYLNLGKLYLERKRFEDAKEVYLRICTCFPCSSVWMRVGEVCHSLGENPDAERALVEANLLDNTNILVWLQISLTCLQGKRKNRIESAWSSYTSALDLMTNDNNTSFSHILTKIATRLFELREFEKCRKICTFIVSSTKLNQNDISRARFCLGKILEAKGLYKDAVKTYNELLGSSSSGGGGGSSSTVPGDVAEEARRRVIRLNELAWS
jgi:tetratricopeptide (TPR) repeat protein